MVAYPLPSQGADIGEEVALRSRPTGTILGLEGPPGAVGSGGGGGGKLGLPVPGFLWPWGKGPLASGSLSHMLGQSCTHGAMRRPRQREWVVALTERGPGSEMGHVPHPHAATRKGCHSNPFSTPVLPPV